MNKEILIDKLALGLTSISAIEFTPAIISTLLPLEVINTTPSEVKDFGSLIVQIIVGIATLITMFKKKKQTIKE